MLSTWHHFDAKCEEGGCFLFGWKKAKMPCRRRNLAGKTGRPNWAPAKEYCDTIVAFDDTEQVTNGSQHFKEHGLQTIMVISLLISPFCCRFKSA